MTTYRPFSYYETVVLKEKTEVTPTLFIDNNVLGIIIDKTVPNYYLVKFEDYGCYWLDGKLLENYISRLINN